MNRQEFARDLREKQQAIASSKQPTLKALGPGD
jgi:hypothetical protein